MSGIVNVLFFAQVRDLINCEQLEIELTVDITAEALRSQLAARGDKWALALTPDKLLVAVNQEVCSMKTVIKAGDEVAFFPPVTGG